MAFGQLLGLLAGSVWLVAAPAPSAFHFVLLGDRTGEAQPGVYEQIWRQVAAEKPAFVVSVGDTIQGGYDATAAQEWQEVDAIVAPYRTIPLYLTPGNHDIWFTAGSGVRSAKTSPISEELFRKHAGHPPHYSFDYGPIHFTILDNSRSEDLSTEEMGFLRQDLEQHASQPVKFIVSHRPSWLVNAGLGNPAFPLHQLAKQYGVQYVIAGHLHQMIHADLDGVIYVCLPSAGGHLRLSGEYEDGWFFGYTSVDVRGTHLEFKVHEIQGRVTNWNDWGLAGLSGARPHTASQTH